MNTSAETKNRPDTQTKNEMGQFFGKMYSFNTSLKLYHWHVSGKGSYAEHMALDQAIEQLSDPLDRIVETSYSMFGDIDIVIPETPVPGNIVEHCEDMYNWMDSTKDEIFEEDFSSSILDDYMEGIQQLLYRLKRLQ